MAVIADKTVAAILDFIAGGVPTNPSGEADGNYNAVIGQPHATQDLSQMTISQIYQRQTQLRASGMPSDAIGRYQFIGSTLHNLVAKLGWPPTTKFTNDRQDALALQLMKGRGYDSWFAGTITDQQFAHNLSMEWASLPDPLNDGKSHYDGDSAGNHASTAMNAVYAMLKAAKAGVVPSPPPGLQSPTDIGSTVPPLQSPREQQIGLAARGLYRGRIDGDWGDLTDAAMQAWFKLMAGA